MHVSTAGFAVIFLTMVLAATVQGSIGFGSNLVLVPVVAIVVPAALPATLIVAGLPLSTSMAWRERHDIDWHGLGWILVGRVPGTAIGAVVVYAVSARVLGVIAGVGVLLAVALSMVGGTFVVRRRSAASAGLAAGVMGTAVAMDGPPLALLYQHHRGPTMRSTLASEFVVGTGLSIAGLLVAREVAAWQMLLAAALVPGLLIGLACSRFVHRVLAERSLRPAVLTLVTLTALSAIAHALAG